MWVILVVLPADPNVQVIDALLFFYRTRLQLRGVILGKQVLWTLSHFRYYLSGCLVALRFFFLYKRSPNDRHRYFGSLLE